MDREAKKKLDSEKKRIRAEAERVKAKVQAETKLKCTFVNLETKGANLEFVFEGNRYRLDDGQEYDLPISVIEHLNSLKVPVMKYKIDPTTGMLKPETEVKQMLQRFSVTPISLREYTEVLKKAQGEIGNAEDNA